MRLLAAEAEAGPMLTEVATLDGVLEAHAAALGGDFVAYRNHTYRVLNFCTALSSAAAEQVERIAIAAAFHDLGIWTAGTFDYLDPSAKLAAEYLLRTGRSEWLPEIDAMIHEHHKLTPTREHPQWLVEPFRRADLVDLSCGLIRFGLRRSFVRNAWAIWPGAGFHRRLVHLTWERLRSHPLNPLPMVKL